MKKLILMLAATVLIAAPAVADMDDMVTVTRTDGTWSGSGGEFTLTPSGGIPGVPDGVAFQTFCVETNEYINIGGQYHVEVNTAAVLGDGGKISNGDPLTGGWGDPLDARTAYLYTRFRDGSLATLGYDYTLGPGGNRPTSAVALQNAIWVIEEESQVVLQDGLATTFKNAADEAVASGAWSGIGDVRILNLYTTTARTEKQDQLVLIPAPAAVLLGVVGLALVGWARKRIR